MKCVDVEGKDAEGNTVVKMLPDAGVPKFPVVRSNAVSAARQESLAYGSREGIRLIEWSLWLTCRSIRCGNGYVNAVWCFKRQVRLVEKCMHATYDAKADCGERNVSNSSSMTTVEWQPVRL